MALILPFGAVPILAVLVGYEILEAGLRRVPIKSGRGVFEYESWPNIVVDVVVAWLAWGIVAWSRGGWPIPLV